jgi:hypothetical protein
MHTIHTILFIRFTRTRIENMYIAALVISKKVTGISKYSMITPPALLSPQPQTLTRVIDGQPPLTAAEEMGGAFFRARRVTLGFLDAFGSVVDSVDIIWPSAPAFRGVAKPGPHVALCKRKHNCQSVCRKCLVVKVRETCSVSAWW